MLGRVFQNVCQILLNLLPRPSVVEFSEVL